MVDYSKWDKIDCSSSDDEKPARKGAGKGQHKPEDKSSDDIPCPSELGPQIRDIWPQLTREKKLHLLELALNGEGPQYHPEKSLHKQLFDPENWHLWIDTALMDVLAEWRKAGSKRSFAEVDLEAFPGMKLEAPGIISFPALNDTFCQLLLEEVKHYHKSGMPSKAPNSMNNYGLVLNQVGMRPVFSRILREVFLPIGAKLFGDDRDRVSTLKGQPVGTENWGGSSLDDHHSFIVQYRPSDDKHLDMHIDECDVTFNFGITETSMFEGNDLTFCGMFDDDAHRRYHHTYKHVKGRCVVHSGKRRHGALDITQGERSSLIMWTKSQTFRETIEYKIRNSRGLKRGPADRVCLSYTHDPDYKELMPKKMQYRMLPKKEENDIMSTASGSTKAAHTEKRWISVCKDEHLKEGKSKMMELEVENEQIAVFRYHGELFAIDNRCAHMGGPLCEGDIEDLASHVARSNGSIRMTNGAKADDGVVKCPRHGMCFNIRTGDNIKGGQMRQKLYPIRLSADGADIEVEVEVEVPLPSTPEE